MTVNPSRSAGVELGERINTLEPTFTEVERKMSEYSSEHGLLP